MAQFFQPLPALRSCRPKAAAVATAQTAFVENFCDAAPEELRRSIIHGHRLSAEPITDGAGYGNAVLPIVGAAVAAHDGLPVVAMVAEDAPSQGEALRQLKGLQGKESILPDGDGHERETVPLQKFSLKKAAPDEVIVKAVAESATLFSR